MAAKVSMRHVAHRAGVSVQTVSRVLNEPDRVSADTRERVQEAIDELGYQPDMLARALRTQRSGLIGIMVHGGSRTGPSSAVAHMSELARGVGFSTLVMTVTPDDPSSSRAALDALLARKVEGIIAIAAQAWAEDAAVTMREHVPVVLVSTQAGPAHLPRAAIDQAHGVRLVVEHLVDQGFRDLLHVTGPLDWFDACQRRSAWIAELTGRRLEPRLLPGGFLAADGYAAGALLASGPLPEAVFAANDFAAYGVLRALHEAGVRVPRDVALVGVDDGEVDAHTVPSLTSLRQPVEDLADAALELLVEAIAQQPPRTVLIEPELKVRESSVRS